METPSSTRRITRSQTSAAASAKNNNILSSKKAKESDKTVTKSKQRSAKMQHQLQDRSALVDTTNGSPIVGLATGNLETPSSAMSKKRMNTRGQFASTPDSGEALLRGQVKTLLQKVKEEAELSKITLEDRPFLDSPMSLIAPTPANTHHVSNLSSNTKVAFPSVTSSPVCEKFLIPQMINKTLHEKRVEPDNLITWSLMLDFCEKFERRDSSECSSELSYLGAFYGTDEDNASIWSIEVNASSTLDDDEEGEEGELSVEEDEEHDFGAHNDGLLAQICEEMSKISVGDGPKFSGKHIRFVYNSDDELQGEEKVRAGDECELKACCA